MSEKGEVSPRPIRTHSNPVRKFIAHAGIAAVTTVSALMAHPPIDAHAQTESLGQSIWDEESAQYFDQEISSDLTPGKIATFVNARVVIAPNAEKYEHFSKAVLSEDLKGAPFLTPKNPYEINKTELVDKPMLKIFGGSKYLVYRTSVEQGSKLVAVPLRPSNWNNLSLLDETGAEMFDRDNENIFPEIKLTIEGISPTNLNRNNEPSLFAGQGQNKHIPVMRVIEKPKPGLK